MGYLERVAESMFQTAPDGRRLFSLGQIGSRPHVVPGPDVEKRLFERSVWILRLAMAALILGCLLGFFHRADVRYLVGAAACLLAFRLLFYLVLRSELRGLERLEGPWRLRLLRDNLRKTETGHSSPNLAGRVIFSLALVGWGGWLLRSAPAVGVVIIALDSPMAVAWGYALFRKLAGGDGSPPAATAR